VCDVMDMYVNSSTKGKLTNPPTSPRRREKMDLKQTNKYVDVRSYLNLPSTLAVPMELNSKG
jgi:hypothetical protein